MKGLGTVIRYIARRLGYTFVMLGVLSVLVYGIFSVLPIDPAALTCGKSCTPAVIEANRHRLGYDLPMIQQYLNFAKGIFVGRTYGTGDIAFTCPAPSFGYSFNQNACVTDLIKSAIPVTLSMAIGAVFMWLAIGIGLGVLAARFKNTILDTLSTGFVLVGTSFPTFLSGLLLFLFVVLKWQLLPFSLGGFTSPLDDFHAWFTQMLLPWITLALLFSAIYARFTRSSVLETSTEDYVRTARAKGVREGTILGKHVLRAALAPIITMAGMDFAGLLGGAIITESIFNLPGLGRLAIASVYEYDLPVIVATTLLAAGIVIVANLVVDVLYAFVDPRVRVA